MPAAKPQVAAVRPEAAHHNERAVALMGMGRYDDAVSALTIAVRIDPTVAVAHSNLATCLYALRRLSEARVAYRPRPAPIRFSSIRACRH